MNISKNQDLSVAMPRQIFFTNSSKFNGSICPTFIKTFGSEFGLGEFRLIFGDGLKFYF